MLRLLSHYFTRLLPAALLTAIVVGCHEPQAAPTDSGTNPTPTATAARREAPPLRETFETYSWQGSPIGKVQTSYFADVLDGRPVVRIVSAGSLSFLRYGQKIDQQIRDVTWETAAGEVLRFESFLLAGSTPQIVTGTITRTIDGQLIRGETLALTLRTAGKTTTVDLDWPHGTGGSTAVVDSLRRNAMTAAGDTRTLTAFAPILNRIATVELTARGKERVEVEGGPRELLRVDSKMLIDRNPALESVFWCDEQGEVWRTDFPALGQSALRTTAAGMNNAPAQATVDLGTDTMVPVAPPLIDAHRTKFVRYRVRLTDGDAAQHFPNGAGQVVKKLADGAVEIAVTAVRPTTPLPAGYVPTAPTLGDRKPSSLVQSDDEEVRKLAAAVDDETADPWNVAVGCEALVHRKLRSVEFSTAFATAAETARTLTGDCTEHAVLLCALLRARSIPARTAMGLVYVERSNAFGYHMWTEAFIAGRWIPLDATLGRGGTSAGYLKIADSNLAGVDSFAAFLPVFPLIGRLQIEVLEQQ